MRKDNPYYKRGRPSQQAYDWEAEQIEIENRGRFLKKETGIICDGEFKGYTWQVLTYEKTTVCKWLFNYGIITIPSENGTGTLIYES
jgi:hypothetical protein